MCNDEEFKAIREKVNGRDIKAEFSQLAEESNKRTKQIQEDGERTIRSIFF